jgi:hypothetical protein
MSRSAGRKTGGPHLLRVDEAASAFAELAARAVAAGWRLGWLELGERPEVPAALAEAAGLPVLRAVAAGPGRTLAVKPLHGAPVLEDLLREHFRGCRLVLVKGEAASASLAAVPALERAGEQVWRVRTAGGARTLTTTELVRALGRPHPFADSAESANS